MSRLQPRYNKEEFAQRGDEIYEHYIRPQLQAEDEGKFVLIDIETGDYEMDVDEIVASDRLLVRNPDAQVLLVRVGSRYARRFGMFHASGAYTSSLSVVSGMTLISGRGA